jgi:predicted membrane protein
MWFRRKVIAPGWRRIVRARITLRCVSVLRPHGTVRREWSSVKTRDLTLGALFIALGVLLPVFFHMVGLGKVFLPMHLPVLLAGFFCGPAVGLSVGAVTPLLSAVTTGMPPLMPPIAQLMAVELAVYGFLTGWLYRRLRWGVYPALLASMLAGRLAYGLSAYFLMPLVGLQRVPVWAPLAYAVGESLPGVVVQLIVVPLVVGLVERSTSVLFSRAGSPER